MDGDLLGMGGDTRAARAETPRGDDPVSEAVAQLQSMFPSVDAAVIEMVYEDMAGGDLEKAIEALLSITDDAVDQPGATEQATADEMIAMQMLQQMMNEEDASKADADKVFAKIQSDTERKENFKKAPATGVTTDHSLTMTTPT
ncbi:hypothetical protein T492DRAFT_1151203 [Pavlovales sp. CCMP2436]|nr:hypothetical protein T492DRAFT_1151203 [Pavlovales sp. CCMP2436]